jgi:hypothetical protein
MSLSIEERQVLADAARILARESAIDNKLASELRAVEGWAFHGKGMQDYKERKAHLPIGLGTNAHRAIYATKAMSAAATTCLTMAHNNRPHVRSGVAVKIDEARDVGWSHVAAGKAAIAEYEGQQEADKG